MTIFNRIRVATVIAAVVLLVSGCKKNETPNGPNDLGGETDIPLTKVGSVTSFYVKMNGVEMPSGEMTVTSNNNGVVNYRLVVDLHGRPDSAFLAGLAPAEYNDGNGHLTADLKLKITSEGIQDYSQGDKPWTIVKYDDNVGDTYPYTTNQGRTLVRTVTEKTGLDDWPFGFFNIKTIKVEEVDPPNVKDASKIVFRANHKFGLVYAELQMRDGTVLNIELIPWFLL